MPAVERMTMGWDIGGAHLKAVTLDGTRALRTVQLLPCPLWQGLEHLTRTMTQALAAQPAPPQRHALTMTGELCDLFRDRADGVAQILHTVQTALAPQAPLVYASDRGLVEAAAPGAVASMNWHAMACALASRVPDALLIDVGSTTTDIIAIAEGVVRAQGLDDRRRLATDELVYQGVARTPLMALCARVPYRGAWQGMAAEHFATTADVYRLLGELPADADLMPSADGRPKTAAESAARLARMVGDDSTAATESALRELAAYLRGAQLARLRASALRVRGAARPPVVVGAGVGRFLVRELASWLALDYCDYAVALDVHGDAIALASDCAPALAVASLALEPA
jgi:(4-(4-[2-(gamma-L-glutamylamino)ethyl]phenoxymethyl)furan-2-yl)methanamine synthase